MGYPSRRFGLGGVFIVFLTLCCASAAKATECPLDWVPDTNEQSISLDRVVDEVSSHTESSPLLPGETHALRHPSYRSLTALAHRLGSQVEWVDSIARRVLELPLHPDRMKVSPDDAMEGWFEEYTDPNLILLDRGTSLATLVHELRHAVHVGSHCRVTGNDLDRAIQVAKRHAGAFRAKLEKSKASERTKTHLREASIRLIETASEISAHTDDLRVAQAVGAKEVVESSIHFRKEYLKEFRKSHQTLKANPLSRQEGFTNPLQRALEDFYRNTLPPNHAR